MSFWENKNVVVTGGAGFVGSHLVEQLIKLNASVKVVDDLSHGSNRVTGVPIIVRDVGNPEALVDIFHTADVVFNLAAFVAGVIYNQAHQLEMFERNARLQTVPVLVADQVQVPHFLQVSSVCVYAPEHNHPAQEENGLLSEPVQANNGYSWSKRIGEKAVQWSDLPHAVIVRPSNIYGPRDYYDERAHVIPALIKKVRSKDPTIKLYGNGNEIREFIYVDDVARGMIAAIEHGAHKEVYNLGASERTSMRDLALLIAEILHIDKEIEILGGSGGDPERWSDCSKAHSALGNWKATMSMREGLIRTISNYINETIATNAA